LQLVEKYLTFCGVAIENCQNFTASLLEYKKNQGNGTKNYNVGYFRPKRQVKDFAHILFIKINFISFNSSRERNLVETIEAFPLAHIFLL
jgi:hypothetical protein